MKNKERMCFGIIIGTRAYFNSELAKDVRKQLLKTLADEGYDYVILPEDATPTGSSSIETREDGLKCAELFRQNRDRIDGIIVSLPNFGFAYVGRTMYFGNQRFRGSLFYRMQSEMLFLPEPGNCHW